jgi:hypothetical protein
MDVDRIGEVSDRDSEGQAAGVYGAGFTSCPLDTALILSSDNFLLNFPPSIRNPLVTPFKNSLVMPSLLCVRRHAVSSD